MYQDYYDKNYHRVYGITAICKSNTAFHGQEYDLNIGECYIVEHLAMFRSCSRVRLQGKEGEYQSQCFDLYENGLPLEVTSERFLSPYLVDEQRLGDIKYNKIPQYIDKLSEEYDVRVLWAVLDGSRKMGYSYPFSDWDVILIYCHNPEWYQVENNKKDTIEVVYENDVDIVGWDIKKVVGEIKKGNPIVLNWLNTNSEWNADYQFIDEIRALVPLCFDPGTAISYYFKTHIALNKNDDKETAYPLKHFFYYLTGVITCMWIEKKRTTPLPLLKMVNELVQDENIRDEIKKIHLMLSLRLSKEKYQVSSRLLDFAQNNADHYKQLTSIGSSFTVDDSTSNKLEMFVEKTIAKNKNNKRDFKF